VYEYDVLLYLKEDIARRNKKRRIENINPFRKCLKTIVLSCKKVFGLVYGTLTLLPKYMCSKKKVDKENDKAFKPPKKVSREQALKYLTKTKTGDDFVNYDHKVSPPWAVIVNILINSLVEADNDWSN